MFRNWWRRLWQMSPVSDLRSARENIDSATENIRMLREAFETGYSMRQGPSLPGDPRRIELTEKGRRIFWGGENIIFQCGCCPGEQTWCPQVKEILESLAADFKNPQIITLRNPQRLEVLVTFDSIELADAARIRAGEAVVRLCEHLGNGAPPLDK